ncbi:MAG TPA: PKD domain-containing protein [Acidobacteria bacterium]|nr:PKD domain-containing protein [Acidobacteriota bacterium]
MRKFPLLFAMLLCLALPDAVFAGEKTDLSRPELSVERIETGTTISVTSRLPDGTTHSQTLRTTRSRVSSPLTGADARSQAVFALWEEDGVRWSATSRDGGRHWSDARALKMELRLRDGALPLGATPPAAPTDLAPRGDERLYIVQFRTRSLPEWRGSLAAAGGRVLAYFPYNAHIVRADPAVMETIAGLDFVERVLPYEPAWRLSPELKAWVESSGEPQIRRVRVMAFEWGSAGKARIAAAAVSLGAEIFTNWPSGHIIEIDLDRQQLRQLVHHDDVMWADPWSAPENDMDLVREDAGTNWIENNFGYCGQDVRGEVMDAGVQDDHMDFDGIMFHGGHDVASHGTSTYGIVFGNGDRDGDGEAKGTGHMPCPEAQGIFADYGNVGDRFAHTEELKSAPYFASFQTNSWGDARTRSYTSVSHQMDDIIWRLDIAITQSQSNAGNQDSRPQAWAKNIISVGGVRHKNTLDTSDDEWSSGASIGPAEDGRIKPDINYWYDSIYTTTTGNGYTSTFGGTSAATPESAGVLGLIVQMWADNVWGTDPQGTTVFEKQPHFATIKALVINNAQQYDFSGTGDDLTRVHQGWGRPSARVAYERASRSLIVDQDVPLQLGESISYDVDVQAGESELKVTMIYPDPPGTTSASLHRINDVNLKVTSPSGTVYHGNVGLDASPYSSPGGTPNDVDTVENVFVQNPEQGLWTVEISAVEINQDAFLDTAEDDVTFALVVTGGAGSVCDGPATDFTITPNPARVGDSVLFDSTVNGGSGGPYTYAWDFDGDGVTDSTEADPTYVYNRPYSGLVTLKTRDSSDCPASVEHDITVTGPDIRFHDYINLTEIEGNANGAIDPGEIWELTVDLRNDGDETAVAVEADLALGAGTAGPVSLLSTSASYQDIPVGGIAAGSPAYRFQVGQDFPCGFNIYFDVVDIRSADPVVTYPAERRAIKLLVGGAGPSVDFFHDGFETGLGWSAAGGGEWQRGAPQGLGSGSSLPGSQAFPDPTSAFEGTNVIGTDLSGQGVVKGNYEDAITSTYTSPAIDASGSVGVEMRLQRWLNVVPQDRAYIQVSPDGSTWTTIWETSDGLTENTWTAMFFDVSDYADRNAGFRIRFGLDSDDQATASGWNIDDLTLSGVTKDSCEPVARGVPGASDGLSITRTGGGLLDLSWNSDCGAGTAYGIYRGDLTLGYDSLKAEPGLCSVSTTSATVDEGPGRADFFLVVPNDAAFEGSYGNPSGGGSRAAAADACYPRDRFDACAP